MRTFTVGVVFVFIDWYYFHFGALLQDENNWIVFFLMFLVCVGATLAVVQDLKEFDI